MDIALETLSFVLSISDSQTLMHAAAIVTRMRVYLKFCNRHVPKKLYFASFFIKKERCEGEEKMSYDQ